LVDELVTQKYIDGMENKYTVSDCIALRKCLDLDPVILYKATDYRDYYDHVVLESLKKAMLQTDRVENIVSIKIKEWVAVVYSGSRRQLVSKFIFDIPLEEVPLYVNEKDVEPFVRWRLSIGK
jgi:hypothetical protein